MANNGKAWRPGQRADGWTVPGTSRADGWSPHKRPDNWSPHGPRRPDQIPGPPGAGSPAVPLDPEVLQRIAEGLGNLGVRLPRGTTGRNLLAAVVAGLVEELERREDKSRAAEAAKYDGSPSAAWADAAPTRDIYGMSADDDLDDDDGGGLLARIRQGLARLGVRLGPGLTPGGLLAAVVRGLEAELGGADDDQADDLHQADLDEARVGDDDQADDDLDADFDFDDQADDDDQDDEDLDDDGEDEDEEPDERTRRRWADECPESRARARPATMGTGFTFSTGLAGTTADGPLAWVRAITVGKHHAPQGVVNATPDRIARWHRSLQEMRRRQLRTPVVWGHDNKANPASARLVAGYVQDSRVGRDGSLELGLEVPGATVDPRGFLRTWQRLRDGRQVPCCVKEVSLAVRDWTDGQRRTWPDAVTHVGLVVRPVVAGQPGFRPAG
jgi:hypothetical protein